ncbi:MAG: Holliday junction branch migration protein RuvA [Actinobacteria bacterium]|nr:Holliday junction branch migration protein RuvA [Actinomycetota bacterium]
MYAFLKGKLAEKGLENIILDVGGIGYYLNLPSSSLSKMPSLGEEILIYTHFHIREDAMQLFGFASVQEKEMFEKLISVNKIGPKVALSILSTLSVSALKKAVLTNDVELISSVPGIGKKSAERLILELKNKLEMPDLEIVSGISKKEESVYLQARNALLGLGYSVTEARNALEVCPVDDEISVEEVLKYALKNLSKT